MAGLPNIIINRANEILKHKFENNDEIFETLADSKLIIDSPRREELNLLADEIKAISINEITPIEALKILNDLKKKI